MAYLITFHEGWLLASLLLGFGMGWIAVVHRGQAVSKVTARWLAVLAAIMVCISAGALGPRPAGLLARPWTGHVCDLSGGLCCRIVAARSDCLTSCCGQLILSRTAIPPRPNPPFWRSAVSPIAAKLWTCRIAIHANMLKERALFSQGIPLCAKTRYDKMSGSERSGRSVKFIRCMRVIAVRG